MLKMKTENTSHVVDIMTRDLPEEQQYRELTKNAVEAIVRAGGSGQIVWGHDPWTLKKDGVYKLCITDTGDGMTERQIFANINTFGSSGGKLSIHDNFGVGAKIAGIAKNPHGLQYYSWRDGRGVMVHFEREGKDFGAKDMLWDDGSVYNYIELEDTLAPRLAKGKWPGHGTKVVLLGRREAEDTCAVANGSRGQGLLRYITEKFFRFPKEVEVYVETNTGTQHEQKRRTYGQAELLDRSCVKKGSVPIRGATVHWWILGEDLQKNTSNERPQPHRAALYQDEVYESDQRNGQAYRDLADFGLVLGAHKRAVIYVEPDTSPDLSANTARTQLLVDGKPLPWSQWAEEFRQKLPAPIQKLVDQAMSGSSESRHDSIGSRLQRLRHFFTKQRFVPRTDGDDKVGDPKDRGYARPNPDPDSSDKKGSGSDRDRKPEDTVPPRKPGGSYSHLQKRGKPGKPVSEIPLPRVSWPDGGIESGRAAHYIIGLDQIEGNLNFDGYQQMLKDVSAGYREGNDAKVVEAAVREAYEQVFTEVVLAARRREGQAGWDQDAVQALYSDEALTAAASAVHEIDRSARTIVGQQLTKKTA